MRPIVLVVLLLTLEGVAYSDFQAAPTLRDPSLAAMANEIETLYAQQSKSSSEGGEHAARGGHSEPAEQSMSDLLSVGGKFNDAFAAARNAADWWDASNLLDSVTDPSYEVTPDDSATPDVPTTICAGSAECTACYARAFSQLSDMRFNLETLRVVGKSTSDYVAKSLALGDGLSGVTGLAALEWQRQRRGINTEFDTFKRDYDKKYDGMMKGLKSAMDHWNQCEAQFGERDWYVRFGYMYEQFMRDKYKRAF
jgi:hypothetical protein